jgi:hypothetical protein
MDDTKTHWDILGQPITMYPIETQPDYQKIKFYQQRPVRP